jgi:hypothetical protein
VPLARWDPAIAQRGSEQQGSLSRDRVVDETCAQLDDGFGRRRTRRSLRAYVRLSRFRIPCGIIPPHNHEERICRHNESSGRQAMRERQFALQWDRPFLPDAATHVSLFDGGTGPMYVVASGHGAGDAEALLDLVRTLQERRESAEAIEYVAREYRTLAEKTSARSR